jgi:predicted DNA-binding ribbon-helix-helix protein
LEGAIKIERCGAEMKKLSINISGHFTSLSLEEEFVSALKKIAAAQKKPVSEIIRGIDENRGINANLSSAVRVWVLMHCENSPAPE